MRTTSNTVRRPKVTRVGMGNGLYKQHVGNSTSWLLRFHLDGRERFLGLGSTKLFSLKEARRRAKREQGRIVDGIDPVEEKRKARVERLLASAKSITFEDAAKEYFRQHQNKWTNDKVRAQFMSSLRKYVFPLIGKMPVADVSTDDVLRVLDPIWHTKIETAGRVRRRLEWVLGWSVVRGHRTGDNPAAWRGHLATALPSRAQIARVQNFKAVPFDEMPTFWEALSKRTGGAARAVQFMILTAARPGEARAATWDEVDFATKTWTIPGSKMKGGVEHVVPLSDAAIAILNDLPRVSEYMFVGPSGKLSENAPMNVLKRMAVDATAHGFRSTFRDWAGDRTNFPHEVIEFALAHHIPDRAAAAYRRYRALDKRRRLMDAWAQYVATPARDASVVPIRRKA